MVGTGQVAPSGTAVALVLGALIVGLVVLVLQFGIEASCGCTTRPPG